MFSEKKINALLEKSKNIVTLSLKNLKKNKDKNYKFLKEKNLSREMKAEIDIFIEKFILDEFLDDQISILSEEFGELKKNCNLKIIIDPLDGTVNYIRGITSCGISIGLFNDNTPIFGVIGEYPSLSLAWGGKNIGSYYNNKKINVSTINHFSNSVICSGFPSRLNFAKDSDTISSTINLFDKFAKVRMLGSASISLLHLARGSVDYYSENKIMLWDIAAGLAILQGAGGHFKLEKTDEKHCYNIKASNGFLDL